MTDFDLEDNVDDRAAASEIPIYEENIVLDHRFCDDDLIIMAR